MGFVAEALPGIRNLFNDCDIKGDKNDKEVELTGELKKAFDASIAKANSLQRGVENSIDFHASDRIFTAPNIPIIGRLVAWYKSRKINTQLKKRINSKRRS